MDQAWQTCPDCDFAFLLAEDELAGPEAVCPECGAFFSFDPDGELPEEPEHSPFGDAG